MTSCRSAELQTLKVQKPAQETYVKFLRTISCSLTPSATFATRCSMGSSLNTHRAVDWV